MACESEIGSPDFEIRTPDLPLKLHRKRLFPRMGEWAFSGKKTQCLDPKD